MPALATTQPDHRLATTYATALATAFLLCPDNALEEDVLRALFLERIRAEGVDGDHVLERMSAELRATGALS